jgi:type VI secretion system protein ImpA
MPSPNILDFDLLLNPIPGTVPSGPDLRTGPSTSSDYMQLKDARLLARNLEREQESLSTTVDWASLLPAWQQVLDLAVQILAKKSKDMEVAAWLAEALARTHGFAGLRDAFRLTTALIERYWDGLHSVEDDNGGPDRAAPFAALNGLDREGPLPAVIRRIPLTQAKASGPYALWQYQQAIRAITAQEDATRIKVQAEEATLDHIIQSAKESGHAYYRILIEDIEACQARFSDMQSTLASKCGPAGAPPAGNIREALAAVLEAVRGLIRDIFPEPAPVDEPGNGPVGVSAIVPADGQERPPVPTSSLTSREEAFRTLLVAADYFRRHEPHSHISYTLEELVRRGRLPLPELLEELIPDESARRTYLLAAGIKPPADGG